MTSFFPNKASVKSCLIKGKDSALVSSVQYLKFDRTTIPSHIAMSSSNDYQFTLSHSAGASFILTASTSIKENGADSSIIFQWYDETNTQYIGFKGSLVSNNLSGAAYKTKNPYYRTACSALIKASDFNGADITISCRVINSTGNPLYSFEPNGFETWSGFPCLHVYQSR